MYVTNLCYFSKIMNILTNNYAIHTRNKNLALYRSKSVVDQATPRLWTLLLCPHK